MRWGAAFSNRRIRALPTRAPAGSSDAGCCRVRPPGCVPDRGSMSAVPAEGADCDGDNHERDPFTPWHPADVTERHYGGAGGGQVEPPSGDQFGSEPMARVRLPRWWRQGDRYRSAAVGGRQSAGSGHFTLLGGGGPTSGSWSATSGACVDPTRTDARSERGSTWSSDLPRHRGFLRAR
jgi:hypothetical protein